MKIQCGIGVGIFLLCQVSVANQWVSFPKNMNWCVATAAHQIEGYNTESDWWDWEEKGKKKDK